MKFYQQLIKKRDRLKMDALNVRRNARLEAYVQGRIDELNQIIPQLMSHEERIEKQHKCQMQMKLPWSIEKERF